MHIVDQLTIDQLPQECIDDCSASGQVAGAVAAWRTKLRFTVHRGNAIRYLRGFGAWDAAELSAMTMVELAERVLWTACGDFHAYQQEVAAGRGDAPRQGAEIVDLLG